MAETQETTQAAGVVSESDKSGLPFGPAAAVFIAAGIGSVVLGLATTLAEASEGVKSALDWYGPVGSLTGKSLLATLVFFVSWGILHAAWKTKDIDKKKIWVWTSILVLLGGLLTFPIFFQFFHSG